MRTILVAFFALISAGSISAIFLSGDGNLVKAELLKSLGPLLNPVTPLPPAEPFVARGGCPLCDRSVYGYCSHKMIHDACCCNSGNVPFHCPPTDCSYLNANSCYEHGLLYTCCCNNPYH